MSSRYRWYGIKLPKGITNLGDVIAKHPLHEETDRGFISIEGLLGNSSYRFVWRSTIFATQLDSKGNPSYHEVSTVNFTDFSIIQRKGGICLRAENPGRTIRDLLNALEGAVGLGFACKAIDFERSKPALVFEQVEVTKLIGLKIVNASFGQDLVGRMEIASKQGIRPDQMDILRGVPHKVDSASYELIHEGIKGQLTIGSNGTVKIGGQLAPKLLSLIEQDLPRML